VSPVRSSLVVLVGALVGALTLAGPATAKGLRVDVSPDRAVPLNETTCFQVSVSNARDLPVGGASVYFLSKRAKTSERGEARICGKPAWPGRHNFFVSRGEKRGHALIKTRQPDAPTGRGWVPVEVQLPAYPDAGDGCSTITFADGSGYCRGYPNPGVESEFLKHTGRGFHDRVIVDWDIPNNPVVELGFKNYSSGRPQEEIKGYLPDRGSGKYYVRSAYSAITGGRYAGGTDPQLMGKPGGPLLISVAAHKSLFGSFDGFTFHIRGYLFAG
jgi:hypothetical protein